MLILTRPLVWLDVETHAKLPPDQARIIEIGYEKIYPPGTKYTADNIEILSDEYCTMVDPRVHIDEAATEVHGIKDEDVFGQPTFQDIAEHLLRELTDVDFAGYNVNFDLQVLKGEADRAFVRAWSFDDAKIVDPLRLWQVKRPRRLENAVREFCGREPSKAHRALADAQDARHVLEAMMEPLGLPSTPAELHALAFPGDPSWIDREGKMVWRQGVPVLAFGKQHNGWPLKDVPASYLRWIIGSNFHSSTKEVARNALQGVYPTKETS